ncbi:Ig-like domain-containing protein [Paenibacillus farraposensis]|uniref:Ig-like domain-containing protein n=1 Tax=Paenibacillus farraposensis TaxID=2807095 RepID=A0ABW4DL20_9BACL|nr:Ig-like domain-containing protein [Paenibacillus farraposensis]MCC3380158.1 Ig-like domain-containing protein [Paenibacillus farraposensis]
MKRLRKAISVMLCTMLLFAIGATANASPSTEGVPDQVIKTESEIPLTTVKEDKIEHLTRSDKPDSVTSSVYVLQDNLNFKAPETTSLKKETVSSLKTSLMAASATASTATYSGTITQEGDTQFLYPIYLQPGELLQARLDGPFSAQLDYDLYLYEFDMTTGDINPNAIDASTYGTYFNKYEQGSASLPESVGTRNAAGFEKAYAIAVHSKKGSSITDPFYLTVDVSSQYDAYEPDESAFHAYNFTFSTGGSSLNSRSINSGIDNDWYRITIPASRNYDGLNVKLDSTSESYGYKAEVYGALTGNQMVLLPQTNHNVSLNTGTYYVRVYTTNQYSPDHLYTLTLKPVLRAGKIVITGYDSINGPNDYPSYSYGRHYRVNGNTNLTVKGVVTTTDNYPVANAPVNVTWLNQNWTESSGNRTRTGTGYTDQNGTFSLTLSLPHSTGSIAEYLSGPIRFTHYYDLSGVAAQVSDTSLTATDIVYHFAYSIYGGRS